MVHQTPLEQNWIKSNFLFIFFQFFFSFFFLIYIARTSHLIVGTPTPVDITIQPDRTFTFVVKSPPTAYLIKQAAGIETGSGEAGKIGSSGVGNLSIKHLFEIAKIKQGDEHLRNISLESISKSIIGSAKSMGVKIIPWKEFHKGMIGNCIKLELDVLQYSL